MMPSYEKKWLFCSGCHGNQARPMIGKNGANVTQKLNMNNRLTPYLEEDTWEQYA